jgi:hypothetical protein
MRRHRSAPELPHKKLEPVRTGVQKLFRCCERFRSLPSPGSLESLECHESQGIPGCFTTIFTVSSNNSTRCQRRRRSATTSICRCARANHEAHEGLTTRTRRARRSQPRRTRKVGRRVGQVGPVRYWDDLPTCLTALLALFPQLALLALSDPHPNSRAASRA